jgi:glycosyltransferase involved in cell wall biosynthesis
MYIAVLGPIATNDLLRPAEMDGRAYPVGRTGAPLVSNLIREFVARGHRVLALTLDDKLGDDDLPFVHEGPSLTYVVVPSRSRIFRLNGQRLGRTADFFWFERRQLLAQLRHYRPEAVHAHWTYEFAMAALAYNPNALVTVHDNALTILRYVRTFNRLFHLVMARYIFWKGRRFTAVSPYTAKSVQCWTHNLVRVVPNPVVVPERTSQTRAPLNAPILSVVVNGWDDHKNNKNALLAFKEVQKRHPTARLWAMGTAFKPNEEAAEFCRVHDVQNVVFMGPTPHHEALAHIAASTLLLHTSLEESFGMVLVEAMAYGVPVVAGQSSGAVPWVVADGGLLVDVTSVAAIADAVTRLLTNPVLYEQVAARAVAIVAERFPLAKVADHYLTLLSGA